MCLHRYTFFHLSQAVGAVLEAWRSLLLRLLDMFDTTARTMFVDTNGDGKADAEISVSGRSRGLSGKEVRGAAHLRWRPRPMCGTTIRSPHDT